MTPTQWLDQMQKIWLTQKPDLIAELLSNNLEYHENPTEPPLTKIDDVVRAWQDIKEQNIEYVEIEILHEHNNICMALWKFKEINLSEHVGSYYLELDTNGKCKLFRQWWNSK